MSKLLELDALVSEVANAAFRCAPMTNWTRTRLVSKYTPDGSVSGHDFDFTLDSGAVDKGSSPARNAELEIGDLTRRHWQLTQDFGLARWYKMIVTVERTGKFSVEFEYKDDYKVGDIMQRG